MKNEKERYDLSPKELPEKWYNIIPDLPTPPPPPKDPDDGPSRLDNLNKVFTKEILTQEMCEDRYVEIPEEVRELYRQAGRPRPLIRARGLEEELETPAKLYYKSEFESPTGSHKVNTALPQAFYAKQQGIERLTTETGAGQWGTALAYACSLVGLDITVYWVRAASSWKQDRRNLMQLYGADVHDSPSTQTKIGEEMLNEDSDHEGSLGIAISEALQDAKTDENAAYSLGSVLNHVLLHQTIIGLETKKQFKRAGDYPDVVISCVGGGSNFGGLAIPFAADRINDGKETEFIAAQSEAAPNLKGDYRYDFGDYAEQTPLMKMFTLGHQSAMPSIKADGLRYHGAAPIISALKNEGFIDTIIFPQDEEYVFDRAKTFIQSEGFLPALESAYSVAAAIDKAKECKRKGEEKTIVFNVSGNGFMDMEGYRDVLGLG
ncbi:MAG: TrpB-like pyridoxal phosphate-dependent enzyme [Candidatus Thermoplasmatota archaeon]